MGHLIKKMYLKIEMTLKMVNLFILVLQAIFGCYFKQPEKLK